MLVRTSVELPSEIVLSADVPAGALRLYAIMLVHSDDKHCCRFRRSVLAEIAGLSEMTCRKYIEILKNQGYITSMGSGQFSILDAAETFWLGRLEQVKRRLARSQFLGEAIMREWLNLLVASDRFEDNARPGFNVNPLTDERFEYDRYYPELGVAFEFNGPQHYAATVRFPNSEEARKTRAYDAMKQGIAKANNVTLIIIEAKDLSLKGMLAKIGNLLPLTPGAEKSPVAAYLERESTAYRNRARSFTDSLSR